ncbi:MAG TPA: carbohydrate kinase family protein [Acidimicrobiales bacterium]|nr:carbohydrate kinase family protein [Acidimicrobiales bacterium]
MTYVTHAQRFDVICVGDVAADVFITLPSDRVQERVDGNGRWLELPAGVKFPYERETTVAAGGAAANVSVGLSRQGLRVSLAAFLAHDEIGRDLLSALHSEHVDTRLMHVDSPAHTNRNFVLSLHGERTILVRHGSFGYHWPHLRPSEVPTWIYLTSLGPDASEYEEQIAEWLDENPAVRLVLQPGTFQVEHGAKRMSRLLERSDVLVCSLPDAVEILESPAADELEMLAALRRLGPRHVVLIDEHGGGVAAEEAGRYRVPRFPDSSVPLDRTGAIDGFAAAVVAGVVRGLPLREALRRGPVNFMSVSHELGSQAGLLRDEQLRAMLEEEPWFAAASC